MATLYVENLPNELYEALRKRAKAQRRSVAAEVRALLEQHLPSARELKRRKEAVRKLQQLRFTRSASGQSFPTSEEMIREDRER